MPQQTFLLKQRGIQFYISLFSLFFPFSNASPSDLQSTKDASPFRPQVSSQLSSQTAAVGSTQTQSSSSTQQPGDRRTALLSPAVGLLLSLKLICHTALLSPAVGLLLSLKLTCHADFLSPAVDLLPFFSWSTSQFYPPLGNRSALLAT